MNPLFLIINIGILARDIESDNKDMKDRGYDHIDVVVCNLYPFESTIAKPDVTLADAVENIDIGECFSLLIFSFLTSPIK